MRFEFNETGSFHRMLTVAAFLAAAVAPLTAAANPSNGGSANQSNGGSRPAGAGTLMHSGTAISTMHQSQWLTAPAQWPAAPDRKIHRERFARNYDWTWFKSQPQCNSAMWMHPELATNVYGTTTASCWWQNTPLWVP